MGKESPDDRGFPPVVWAFILLHIIAILAGWIVLSGGYIELN